MQRFNKEFIWTISIFISIIISNLSLVNSLEAEPNLDPDLSFVNSSSKDTHLISKRSELESFRGFQFDSVGGPVNESAFKITRRIYNSSIALTIPFFSFKIPQWTNGGFIANQAIYGVFAAAITGITFGLSFIFTGSVPTNSQSRSFNRLSNSARKSSFNFLGPEFSKSFGMDGMQCIQKIICQSNRLPESRKYGIIASTIRSLFPAPVNATLTTEDELTSFQSAARLGKYSTKDCEQLYDCILDPLGAARYLIHRYSQENENARFLSTLVDYNYDNIGKHIMS